MQSLRVLIFSATFGAGHVRAAEAVSEALLARAPQTEVIHLDFGEFLSKTINKVIKSTYIELIKYTPKLWGKFYYRTTKISPDSVLQRFLNKLGRREFLRYIHNLRPDVIICTYPTVAGVLAELRLKKVLAIPVVTIVTDYTVHGQWIHPGVDLYIAGCQEVRDNLIRRGIEPGRIQVTGIPVSPKFEGQPDRGKILNRLGLAAGVPTVLVMGGAYGVLGGVKQVVKYLGDSEEPVQSIVVCGRDEKLFKSLDQIIEEARNPIVRFGFVTNVEELMTAADLIITKAGGLTVSESLTKGLPLIIYKPIPGQEEANAHFLTRIGAGKLAYTEGELEETLSGLLQDPEKLSKMRKAATSALPGRAAERAVDHILELQDPLISNDKFGRMGNVNLPIY
ncbi:MAG: MGDG synthase family glycosyltransferase [Desulfitobacteriaceae bacterium]